MSLPVFIWHKLLSHKTHLIFISFILNTAFGGILVIVIRHISLYPGWFPDLFLNIICSSIFSVRLVIWLLFLVIVFGMPCNQPFIQGFSLVQFPLKILKVLIIISFALSFKKYMRILWTVLCPWQNYLNWTNALCEKPLKKLNLEFDSPSGD